MARRKLEARLWQVWCYSALDDGKTYWLHVATPDYRRAKDEYDRLTADYTKAELRDPTNHVHESHNPVRVEMDRVFSRLDLYPNAI